MTELSDNFYIIGHRGAAGELFENSLEGFEYALSLGVDMIEIDIRQNGDDLWVFHDHDLERLTGKPGLFENQSEPAKIRLLNGEPVPTLKQVLDMTWGKMPLNIEIKALDDLDLLLDLLASYPRPPADAALPWILISSFLHQSIAELRRRGCPWPLAPITTGDQLEIRAELDSISPWSWHFDNDFMNFALVDRLREQGIPSFVFTVNSVERARELRQRGVAGIFTDYPSKMLQID